MKRFFLILPIPPSFYGCIALTMGIVLSQFSYVFFCALISLLVCFVALRRKLFIILMLFLVVGYVRSLYLRASYQDSTHYFVEQSANEPLRAEVLILSKTRILNRFYSTYLTVRIDSLLNRKPPTHRRLSLYLGSSVQVEIGDRVFIKNLVVLPQKDNSYLRYLYKEGIVASVYSKKLSLKKLQTHTTLNSLRARMRKKLLKNMRNKLSKEAYSLVSSLFFGKRTSLPNSVRDQFAWWGILHILARSGFHLVVLLSLVQKTLQILSVPFLPIQLLSLIILTMYSSLTWAGISYIRALITTLLALCFLILKKPVQPLHTFSLCSITILIENPFHLYFLDFQLSFGITLLLIIFTQINHQERVSMTLKSSKIP